MKEQCITDVPYGIQNDLAKDGWEIKQVICTFVDAFTMKKMASVLAERETKEEEKSK